MFSRFLKLFLLKKISSPNFLKTIFVIQSFLPKSAFPIKKIEQQAGAELCQAHSCEAGVLNELKTKVEVEVELGYIVED